MCFAEIIRADQDELDRIRGEHKALVAIGSWAEKLLPLVKLTVDRYVVDKDLFDQMPVLRPTFHHVGWARAAVDDDRLMELLKECEFPFRFLS